MIQAKTILTNVLSGVAGGVFCLFMYHSFGSGKVITQELPKARTVSEISSSPLAAVTGPDFTLAAQKSTSAVVHIYVEESELHVQNRLNDARRGRPQSIFDNFFGNDIFGGDFYRQKSGSGSGVIYSKDGYIVTNNHVVGFADNIEVALADGKKYKAKKIGIDQNTDLAVLKIEADNLKPMEIADSDKLQIGEWVLAVGNPFDYLTSTVTAGIISAKGRDLGLIESDKSIEEFIQTDAVINPGNSGGALVTSDGKLAGITTAIATPTGVYAGYSFAIPSNLMKSIAASIIEKGGDIERINLGIGGYDVDKDLIAELKLKAGKGFYVEELDVQSPAKLAGILPGDVITKIDNASVQSFEDIASAMKYSKKGDTIKIVVNRNGNEVTIPTYLR